jgi:hypothetical protein
MQSASIILAVRLTSTCPDKPDSIPKVQLMLNYPDIQLLHASSVAVVANLFNRHAQTRVPGDSSRHLLTLLEVEKRLGIL